VTAGWVALGIAIVELIVSEVVGVVIWDSELFVCASEEVVAADCAIANW